MEYRTKKYDESSGWTDEADDEITNRIHEEPKERYYHQLLYFAINASLNIIIGGWFYFLSNAHICKVGFFEDFGIL